jgi:hydrogenase nickel incorporation protein HypB
MCVTCGCGPADHGHEHHHHEHSHQSGPVHSAHAGGARGVAESRRVQVERDLLARNDAYAAANRLGFEQRGTLVLNLVSSPGSGKTTLLVRTLEALRGQPGIGVIEGDQQTTLDADRIRATGAPAVQINTGKGCHLDAHQVAHALDALPPLAGGVLFIENVGNLVCPASFDLGEAAKVVVLSCTEGADKPLKYPDMFRAARLMLVTKADLLPYVPFSVDEAIAHARRINPELEVLVLSTSSGTGFDAWLAWIEHERAVRRVASVAGRTPIRIQSPVARVIT